MKNIHIIPTDKPSRLWVNNLRRRLELDKDVLIGSNTAQHIYITNSEEIKEGDYGVLGKEVLSYRQMHKKWGMPQGLKIILTTDPDLIKDGVQAINDEFLEWFVKNPSCEEVEVERDSREVGGHNGGVAIEYGLYEIIIPKEESKQETLEEAAEKYGEPFDNRFWASNAFKAGAKWQQERMYSKEEVFNLCREFAIFVQRNGPSYKKQQEWFEQNKKK